MKRQEGADWRRLGAYVLARRTVMGHRSQAAFEGATGFGARTLGDIERGERRSYSATTLARLETALGWRVGSVQSVLAGGEPLTIEIRQVPSPPGVEIYVAEFSEAVESVTPEKREEAVQLALRVLRAMRGPV